jgi:hypothetical protein
MTTLGAVPNLIRVLGNAPAALATIAVHRDEKGSTLMRKHEVAVKKRSAILLCENQEVLVGKKS